MRSAYYDLCVTPPTNKTLEFLFNYGYRTIAINTLVTEDVLETGATGKKKKGENKSIHEIIPQPAKINCEDYNFTILNRLTLAVSNQENFGILCRNDVVKKYDILAILPRTAAALQYACGAADVDIITFDHSSSSLKFSRKTFKVAVERNIAFELLYSRAILNESSRKDFICLAHNFHTLGKSKNVIISSGTNDPYIFRSPYDIINLGTILGLSEEKCRSAISDVCRRVLVHAEGRRIGKAVIVGIEREMSIIEIDSEEEKIDSEPGSKRKKIK